MANAGTIGAAADGSVSRLRKNPSPTIGEGRVFQADA